MNAKLTLDKAGRIVLPKAIRDELNLSPGDSLDLNTSGERISLQPIRPEPTLRKERGVWVSHTGQRLSAAVVDDVVRKVREERVRAALGEDL